MPQESLLCVPMLQIGDKFFVLCNTSLCWLLEHATIVTRVMCDTLPSEFDTVFFVTLWNRKAVKELHNIDREGSLVIKKASI